MLGIVLGAVWLLAVVVVSTTLTGIFQTALYRFATGKPVPGFEPATSPERSAPAFPVLTRPFAAPSGNHGNPGLQAYCPV